MTAPPRLDDRPPAIEGEPPPVSEVARTRPGSSLGRRLVPVLSALLATAFLGGTVAGSPVISLMVLGPILALLAYVLRLRRRPPPAESAWSTPTKSRTVVAALGTPRQVAAALGRVESRELAFSVWFGVGLGLLLVILVVFGVVYAGDNGDTWMDTAGMAPWFAHPLAGMTVLAVHRAVTRPARDGTDELFESCPTEPAVRTLAVLRTAVVPVSVFAGFLVTYGLALHLGSPALHGPVSADALAVLIGGLVLAAGAVFLGVALGSWVRFALAPLVAVVGVGLVSLRLMAAGDPGWNGLAGLSTFGPNADSPLLRSLLPTWPYLLWITALSVVVAVVATLRFRRSRRVWLTGLAAAGVALAAAALATAPPDEADAQHVADLIARPADHQICEQPAGARVEICTYRDYGELRGRVVTAIEPVGRALPAGVGPVTVRQGFQGTEADLPAEVRRRLASGIPEPGGNEVRIEFAGDDNALLEYRLLVAFIALGLPLPADADEDGPLDIGGEARGVVGLWLAARGLELDDALHLATVESPGDSDENLLRGGGHDAFERGLAWPTMCGPVVWSPQDLEAARALMRVPVAQVASVLEGGFARWSDPATGTDELLAELGLPSIGRQEEIVRRTESFC